MKSKIRTYTELMQLRTYEERLEYLRLWGKVGEDTFGFDRVFNQMFYRSKEWGEVRDYVIVRDNGCDLACLDRIIVPDTKGAIKRKPSIIIHHMNPINLEDIVEVSDYLMNPEYLITTSLKTHNFIHYGGKDSVIRDTFKERFAGDTCPWRRVGREGLYGRR